MSIPYQKILCPIDFSSYSKKALDKAAGLITPGKNDLLVTHVVNNPWSEQYSEHLSTIWGNNSGMEKACAEQPFSFLSNVLIKTATEMVKEFMTTHFPDLPHQIHVTHHEHIHQAIIDCTKAQKVDLIVMSTHGRSGPKRLYFGSVTENVVRRAPCSVMVVRP